MKRHQTEDERQNMAGTGTETDVGLTQRRSRRVRGKLLIKRLHKMTKGQIYFVRAGDAIKIGFSTDSVSRIATLQTSNAEALELLGTVSGTEKDEQRLHAMFRHLHLRGEWFTAGADLLGYIELTTEEGRAAAAARAKEARKRPKVETTPEICGLIAMRVSFGADTPDGHTCSNLIELLQALPNYVRPEWATHPTQTLQWQIDHQMKRFAGHQTIQ